ncbi:MAG: FAD-dependent oxidoreductase [Intestinibacter sp.]|uniref:FAD-dependent oxidoreductase n=2 Tax=Intestinibacter sp. TaxID=1965304 RepID=UPI002A81525A|nr:FAD-dependent oxidoreductase [Intestinibacter sp.]MDY4576262.1 FAD-dependent oxidoreductase [Intestinibacter sp.]
MENSFWILNSENTNYPTLDKNIETDYLIVGAGLTGLHTAYLLAGQNKKITVIDADKVGYGSSGRNTGKITSSHGLIYDSISKKYGDEKARLYYEANQKGVRLIEDIINKYDIDCNFEKLPNYIFTEDEDYVNQIKQEYKTCERLKIPYEYLNDIEDFPLDIKAALKLDDQAQFNTKKYIDKLAEINKSKGVCIYENTPVVGLTREDDTYIVKAKDNIEIKTKTLIIASSNPWYDGLRFYFSKQKASRSYLTLSKLNKPIAKGMFINVEKPSKTIRIYTDKGQDYLLCGGFDHKTGKCDDEKEIFDKIVDFAKNNFKIGTIEYKWSTQDYITTDNIPYIGRINNEENNIYIATGFCKWGISTSAVAAIIFRDLIVNGSSGYEDVFNPSRAGSYLNFNCLKENSIMAYDYIKGKIKKGSTELDLEKEEGKVVIIDGDKYGAYKDKDGKVFVVDITCTHLGCELEFNSFEKSWDCPCHGSRFNYDGTVLNGPALKPLKLLGMEDNDIDPDLV